MTVGSSPKDWSVEEPSLATTAAGDGVTVTPLGDWTIRRANQLETLINGLLVETGLAAPGRRGKAKHAAHRPSAGGGMTVDLARIGRLDTLGALLLNRLFRAAGRGLTLINVSDTQRILIEEVAASDKQPGPPAARDSALVRFVMPLGRMGLALFHETRQVLAILGGATIGLGRWLTLRSRFRFAAYVTQLEKTGLSAVPIIALMSFIIGGILAQQGAFYFRRFNAEIYVVDLTGMLSLRELGVLLTAVMVAGRSGSSITAELGSMKMREEIDAMRVLGLDPVEVLILPRLLALITALPILTFISDLASIFGAVLDSAAFGAIPTGVFMARLADAIDLQTFFVGMSKAPFMALIIGLIASLEGLQVAGSAESLGERTTQAVVKSIFLVIVVDGIFAVFFASIGV